MAAPNTNTSGVWDELMKELERLIKSITEESSEKQKGFKEDVNKAIQILLTLRDLKEKGFKEDVNKAIQILLTLRDLKKQQSIPPPLSTGTKRPRDDPSTLLQSYLKGLSSSDLNEQEGAAWCLRSSTKRFPDFRAAFLESNEFLSGLLHPMTRSDINPRVRHDLIVALRSLSFDETTNKMVAESPMVLPVLLDALQSGTAYTNIKAAETLLALSALDATKSLIGKSGTLGRLIDLLEKDDHSFVTQDVASTIRMCVVDNDENKARAVELGVVRVVLKKIEERVDFMDELLEILVLLSDHPQAVAEMADLGAVPCLFSVIKETDFEQDTEDCISVINRICFKDESKWKEMLDEEGTISKVAETGTSTAKRNAYEILDRIGIRPPPRA